MRNGRKDSGLYTQWGKHSSLTIISVWCSTRDKMGIGSLGSYIDVRVRVTIPSTVSPSVVRTAISFQVVLCSSSRVACQAVSGWMQTI